MKAKTQLQEVRKHLNTFKSITSWEAITKYRITRLSAYILILRKKGMRIKSKRMEGGLNKNWYTKYTIK